VPTLQDVRKSLLILPLSVAVAGAADAAPNPSMRVAPSEIAQGNSFTATGTHWPVIEFCEREIRFSLHSAQNAFRIGKAKVTRRGKFNFTYVVKASKVGKGKWTLQAKQRCESGNDGSPTPIIVSAPIKIR
jgi:hypothetical protein